jgi:hypothetical protein
MRVTTVVLSFLAALLVTAAALVYIPAYIGQSRIYPEGPPDQAVAETKAYQSYGSVAQGNVGSDPNHQRYYSESEGWTY